MHLSEEIWKENHVRKVDDADASLWKWWPRDWLWDGSSGRALAPGVQGRGCYLQAADAERRGTQTYLPPLQHPLWRRLAKKSTFNPVRFLNVTTYLQEILKDILGMQSGKPRLRNYRTNNLVSSTNKSQWIRKIRRGNLESKRNLGSISANHTIGPSFES